MSDIETTIAAPVNPYTPLLTKLSSQQLVDLWGAVAEANHISVPEDDQIYAEDGTLLPAEQIADTLATTFVDKEVPHVEVVLASASLPDSSIAEALMQKPIHKGPVGGGTSRPPKVPKAGGGVRAPKGESVAFDDTRVFATVAPNPKKQGSAAWDRYALYVVGETVADFYKKGGTKGDVKWDSDRKFITFAE